MNWFINKDIMLYRQKNNNIDMEKIRKLRKPINNKKWVV